MNVVVSQKILSQIISSRFTNVSFKRILLEYFQTFTLEATLIWPIKWNYIKYVFFVNRYLPFVVVAHVIYYNVAPGPLTPHDCKILFSVPAMGIAVGILVADVLLYIRLYALSGRSRLIQLFLIGNLASVVIVCVTSFALYLVAGKWIPTTDPERVVCLGQSSGGTYVMICYATLLYSAVVTMGLSLWYGLRLYRVSRNNRLIKILYRDGSFYFVTIAVFSIANGLVAMLAPARYRFLLAVPQGVLHNILSTRMILHLRETARAEMGFHTTNGGHIYGSQDLHATVSARVRAQSTLNQSLSPFESDLSTSEWANEYSLQSTYGSAGGAVRV
ncbi:hypothetical protein FA15DRAFT_595148 [Coprinopsis marcescibilis]|uniref:DUF6533 domain-containing protein n=1 Tax=Coprinopsis marcescibilis TaxID=230819 RepID=A0A5C3KR88_COPMA|nr:hypothetical protein FA15DRAFT_595148 [Coprinopsis marcescibilis]